MTAGYKGSRDKQSRSPLAVHVWTPTKACAVSARSTRSEGAPLLLVREVLRVSCPVKNMWDEIFSFWLIFLKRYKTSFSGTFLCLKWRNSIRSVSQDGGAHFACYLFFRWSWCRSKKLKMSKLLTSNLKSPTKVLPVRTKLVLNVTSSLFETKKRR